ncbi:MAG: hypothetical protein IPK32_26075 [Verrucomicrobiaceae bacterium]|nr:hypothetical protein [Verrucomicrobiaceae bacterium]
MDIPDKLETQVVITQVLSPRTAHATLPNGKQVYAFIDAKKEPFLIQEGQSMAVRLDVADFSRAELLTPAKNAV